MTKDSIRLERCVPGGDALGHLEAGPIVFVSGGFPGDVIAVDELEQRGGYARAASWRLLEPSPSRRLSPCPIAARGASSETGGCGGCDWMGIADETQDSLKLELVVDALRRVGKITNLPAPLQLTRAGDRLGYRSRLRLHVSTDGTLGLFARGSRDIVPVTECLVCTPEVNAAIERLTQSVQGLSSESRKNLGATFEHIEIRCLAETAELWLTERRDARGKPTHPPDASLRNWIKQLKRQFETRGAKKSSSKRLKGATSRALPVTLPVAEHALELRVVPGAFTQVNWQVNGAIIDELTTGAQRRNVRTFVDLFCGVGNFSIPLLAVGLSGVGIEEDPEAVECARLAAAAQDLGARFDSARVDHAVQQLLRTKTRFDLVVVDPPRSGMGKGVEKIASLAERWIFYCACDPVSFARDLRRLGELGFELDSLRAYDMFPQTHHVELTAWLKRVRSIEPE
jgi:23S rRNA (uracil1939-C5)-methyltransferase